MEKIRAAIAKRKIAQHPVINAIFTQAKLLYQRFYQRKRMPWVILIGPHSAGKSTLLSNTELHVNPESHLLADTGLINWHFGERALFVELEDASFLDKDTPENAALWQQWLMQFKSLHRRKTYTIVVVLDIQKILTQSETHTQAQCENIKQKLATLSTELKFSLPVQVIFNKCDLIAGFVEFFGDMSLEERCQYWGMRLSKGSFAISLIKDLQENYASMLTRLQQQLIWRLHQDNDIDRRVLIKDFPLQLEKIKDSLLLFLNNIFGESYFSNAVSLQGIYFTSALQQGIPLDPLAEPMARTFALQPLQLLKHARANKAYFAQQLFDELILPTPQKKRFHVATSTLNRVAVYALGITVSLAVAIYTFKGYELRINQLGQVQKSLARFQFADKNDGTANTLKTLQSLSEVVYLLQANQKAFGAPAIKKLRNETEKSYRALLQKQLFPHLRDLAYQQLYQVNPRDPVAIYKALRIYLMLGDAKHFDKQSIKNWLQATWQKNNADSQTLQLLQNQVSDQIFPSNAPAALNQRLINLARMTLLKLTYPQLALIILHADIDKADMVLFDNSLQKYFVTPIKTMPYIYTAEGFGAITTAQINNATQAAINGNWVLGEQNNVAPTAQQMQTIQEQLKLLYGETYQALWQAVLNNTQLKPTSSLSEQLALLNTMTQADSPLLRYLSLIDLNTAPLRLKFINLPNHAVSTPALSMQLQALHGFLLNSKRAGSQPLFSALSNLQALLSSCAPNSAHEQACLTIVATHMQNADNADALNALRQHIQTTPEPMQSWLTTLYQQTWQSLLTQAYAIINQRWHNTVYQAYQNRIANRFPINADATSQISLDDFSRFFGANGLVQKFIDDNLHAFIDTHQATWKIKTRDGLGLALNKNTLLQLQLASFIRKIYFPENDDQINIAFTLQPVSLGGNIKNFTLNYYSKNIQFDHDNPPTQVSLTWPLASDLTPINVSATLNDGQAVSDAAPGPWGFFKLLSKAKLQTTDDPRRFLLSFDFNGSSVKYILNATDALNPFLPHVLTEFALNEKF